MEADKTLDTTGNADTTMEVDDDDEPPTKKAKKKKKKDKRKSE